MKKNRKVDIYGMCGAGSLLFFSWFLLPFLGLQTIRLFRQREMQVQEKRHGLQAKTAGMKESLLNESAVFRLANRLGGRLTVSDTVIELGSGVKEAEKFLTDLVDGVRVRMEVKDDGAVVYEFPELMNRSDSV